LGIRAGSEKKEAAAGRELGTAKRKKVTISGRGWQRRRTSSEEKVLTLDGLK